MTAPVYPIFINGLTEPQRRANRALVAASYRQHERARWIESAKARVRQARTLDEKLAAREEVLAILDSAA
jgi:hypothetical protein